jgi:hypothetical protein
MDNMDREYLLGKLERGIERAKELLISSIRDEMEESNIGCLSFNLSQMIAQYLMLKGDMKNLDCNNCKSIKNCKEYKERIEVIKIEPNILN